MVNVLTVILSFSIIIIYKNNDCKQVIDKGKHSETL